MPIKNLITLRKGTVSQWNNSNTPLASGEPGYDTTNNILKVGNGTDLWEALKSVLDITGNASISGTIDSKNIILGNKPTPDWNSYTVYNKFDIVKYENNLYFALINFLTECPGGIGPENWFCCPDSIGIRQTDSDCSGSNVIVPNFSPTGYPEGWSLIGSGDLQGSNIYTKNLFIEKLKVGNNSIIETDVYNSSATINHTTIGLLSPSIGKFTNLSTNGSLNVSNGVVYVFENDSPYSAVLGSSGLKLFENNIDIEVSQADTQPRGAQYSSANFLTADGSTTIGGGEPSPFPNVPDDEDIVLFTNFENPVNNGIYQLQQIMQNGEPVFGQFKAIRYAPYINGYSIPNRFGVETSDKVKFILNRNSSGFSTIGSSALIFEADTGDTVMNIQNSLDVEFTESISAKAKYFRIKHPDPDSNYEYLQYGSLESPYNGVRLTGQNQLEKGVCIVELPSYVKYLVKETNINIQLTNHKHHKILFVDNIDVSNNRFVVKGYRSKTGGPFEFFWTFTGERKDIDPLIVEQ